MKTKTKKLRRGFACMTPEKRSAIARLGGKKVSKRKGWMRKIGRAGGTAPHRGHGYVTTNYT